MKARFLPLFVVLAVAVGAANLFATMKFRSLVTPPVPYCLVANNAEKFHNTFIKVKARVVFDEAGSYVFEDCDEIEALSSRLQFEDVDSEVGPVYVEKVLVTNSEFQMKSADAIIEGYFDAHASPGCWAPKFRIQVIKIEWLTEPKPYQNSY
jgi:hypothetical protein